MGTRFQLVKTLDIVVPKNYVHKTRLASFAEARRSEFYYFDNNITDANFAKATVQLKPGQKLRVDIFQIQGMVTSEDCLAFLKNRKAILTGAQGASLIYEQSREGLKGKGRGYISFDEKESLWQDAGDYRRVPYIAAHSGGDFGFYLGCFGGPWSDNCCLLSFRDSE